MDHLNYHHLRHFHYIAREGNLTRAAQKLNVAQSALSSQLRQLEERLGQPLFDRVGRGLELTEAGRIALDHAERIFATGQDLMDTLLHGRAEDRPLRLGAISTLSRNFQLRFLAPVLGGAHAIALRSGNAARLLGELQALTLDVVLTTEPPQGGFRAQLMARHPVGLHGQPHHLGADLSRTLATAPLILPTESSIRSGFEALAARLGITPRIVAEVDDMAMVRLLTRQGLGLAVAPEIVLADEIASGRVTTAPFDLGIEETFYAVTVPRSFPHPLLETLLDTSAS